jgi:hypothetical protein
MWVLLEGVEVLVMVVAWWCGWVFDMVLCL